MICIIYPPCWLEQLYYFVYLLFLSPLSQTQHLFKYQALILSSFSLDTSQRPDRATSCPPELGLSASKTLKISSCFYYFCFLSLICQTRSLISVYILNVHKKHIFWRVLLHWDDNVLLGVLLSSWAECEDLPPATQGASCDLSSLYYQCRLLALYSSHLYT